MKENRVQRSVFSASPVLVLCLTLLFPSVMADKAGAAELGEPMLVAAEGGSTLPVIPKVPERSRAPRRAPGTSQRPDEVPAPTVVAPTPPAAVPSPVVTTPVPVTPPGMAAPRVAAPAPTATPVVEDLLTEPIAPAPEVTKPRRVRQPSAQAQSTPRRKRYDPKLVLDPSPAEPYVTREIYLDGPAPGTAGYRTDRPVWMVDVPTPGPGAAPVPVYGVPSPPSSAMYGAGTLIQGGGVPLHSTQPLGVSNPLPFEPITYMSQQYGPPVGSGYRGVGGHGAYPGAVGSAWPSDRSVVYVDVPPERVSGSLGSERARHAYTQPAFLPDDHRISRGTPMLSQDQVMPRNDLEPDPDRVRPLRPRR